MVPNQPEQRSQRKSDPTRVKISAFGHLSQHSTFIMKTRNLQMTYKMQVYLNIKNKHLRPRTPLLRIRRYKSIRSKSNFFPKPIRLNFCQFVPILSRFVPLWSICPSADPEGGGGRGPGVRTPLRFVRGGSCVEAWWWERGSNGCFYLIVIIFFSARFARQYYTDILLVYTYYKLNVQYEIVILSL